MVSNKLELLQTNDLCGIISQHFFTIMKIHNEKIQSVFDAHITELHKCYALEMPKETNKKAYVYFDELY